MIKINVPWFLRALCGVLAISAFDQLAAQAVSQITGTVVNAHNGEPIGYAHVGLPLRGIGVITNEKGAFKFYFPSDFATDTLTIRHLGFSSRYIPLEQIRTVNLRISLVPETYQTEEVVVRADPDWPKHLLKKAIDHFKDNYPSSMLQMNAFYREKTQNSDDNRFTRLMEAMVDIQDYGIAAHPDRIRIRLNEFRKSTDFADYISERGTKRKLFGRQNQLYDILLQDPVRNYSHNDIVNSAYTLSIYWLKVLLTEPTARVEMRGVTSVDGIPVYRLGFSCKGQDGILYVNSTDFGIFRIEYFKQKFPLQLGALKDDLLVDGRLPMFTDSSQLMLQVDYQRIKNRYYLSFIEWTHLDKIKFSSIRKGEKTFSYNTSLLMVNSITTDRKQMEKVRLGKMVHQDRDLNGIQKKYNKDFWKDYNVLLTTPLEEKILEDLEFERSLEEQFERN